MASGKSTTIKALAEKLDNFIFIDREHLKHLVLKNLERDKRVKISKRILYFLMKEIMKLKKNLLIQETSESDMKKHLRNYINQFHYKIMVFYLDCSVNTAIKRDLKRSNKRRSNTVKEIHNKIRPEKGDIIINTEYNSSKDVLKVIRYNIKMIIK